MSHASAPARRVLTMLVAAGLATAHAPTHAQSQPNRAPLMVGSPSLSVPARSYYTFRPWVRDPDGDRLYFSIANKPPWAQFNTAAGRLTGTPKEIGEWKDIRISVSDGRHTVRLRPFTLTVRPRNSAPSILPSTPGSAVLSWSPPIANTDGSTVRNLSGYVIHYGTDIDCLHRSVVIANPSVTSHVLEDLPAATYYFAVRALTASGAQSGLSNIAARIVE